MAALPLKLSGRSPLEVRRDLRLMEHACLVACRLKLSMLREYFVHLPGEREWPPIPDFPASLARGHGTDAEVAQLMVLVARGTDHLIADPAWRQRVVELYALEFHAGIRTTA